jgi:hypothetical protein
MTQQLHTDVLFIMIQGLIDQSDRRQIAPLQFTKEAQPVFKEIVRQINEQSAQNKCDVGLLKEQQECLKKDIEADLRIIKSLRSLVFEHMDFIDYMDLRKEYNDFCLTQIQNDKGKK